MGLHFICGAGDSASVLCDVAMGKQGSSCIVDGSGLVWGACVMLAWFSDGGVSLSLGASVCVAVGCSSAFAFTWVEVSVVVGSLGTGGGMVDMWDIVCNVAGAVEGMVGVWGVISDVAAVGLGPS